MKFLSARFLLLLSTGVLMAVGFFALYSASMYREAARMDLLVRQMSYAAFALVAAVAISGVDYSHYHRKPILAVGIIVAVCLVLVLHLTGRRINGARSWIDLGFVHFQPSEFIKILAVFLLARILYAKRDRLRIPGESLAPALVLLGLIAVAVGLEPDWGTAAIIALIWLIMLLMAEVRGAKIFLVCGVLLVVGVLAAHEWVCRILYAADIPSLSHVIERIDTFKEGFLTLDGGSYHIVQSKRATGAGGLVGVGFGEGSIKLGYLPHLTTDSIFPHLMEETGFVGGLLILVFYAAYFFSGMRICLACEDLHGRLLACGMTSLVVAPGILNMGVSLGMAPATGLPLSFVSYGGSNLLFNLIATGIIFQVSTGGRTWKGYTLLASVISHFASLGWNTCARIVEYARDDTNKQWAL